MGLQLLTRGRDAHSSELQANKMWKSRWSPVKCLFFVTRYLPFIDVPLSIYCEYPGSRFELRQLTSVRVHDALGITPKVRESCFYLGLSSPRLASLEVQTVMDHGVKYVKILYLADGGCLLGCTSSIASFLIGVAVAEGTATQDQCLYQELAPSLHLSNSMYSSVRFVSQK